MKRQAVLFCAIIVAPAPTLAQAQQFDLVCSGLMKSTSVGGKQVKPYDKTIRIDLDEGKWCEGECLALHDIAEVQPIQITFTDKEVDTRDEQSFTKEFVNRQTGVHRAFSSGRYPRFPELTVSLEWEGTCRSEPFSGFTKPKTQF